MRMVVVAVTSALALALATAGRGGVAADVAAIGAAQGADIEIPAGVAPAIDGVVADAEWQDAVGVSIEAAPGWEVDVLLKHDGQHLYVAYTNLRRDGAELYAELLIGTAADTATEWRPTDHWFHASYQDCDSTGRPNDYSTCSPGRPGWTANNFPLADGAGVEMSVSFDRLGLDAGAAHVVRLAVNVTDTRQQWLFWPAAASLEAPSSWARARLN